MSKRTKIIIAAVIAAILVIGGGAVWATSQAKPEASEKPGGIYVEPTVAPIVEEDEEDPALEGEHDPQHGDGDENEHAVDHNHGDVVDLTNSEQVAENVIREFLKIDKNESAEARYARLAPYLADGAAVPAQPALAKPGGYNLVGLEATMEILDIPTAQIYSVSADNQYYVYGVVVHFKLTYVTPSEKQVITDKRTWQVSLPADLNLPQKVYSIVEPTG